MLRRCWYNSLLLVKLENIDQKPMLRLTKNEKQQAIGLVRYVEDVSNFGVSKYRLGAHIKDQYYHNVTNVWDCDGHAKISAGIRFKEHSHFKRRIMILLATRERTCQGIVKM